MPSHRSIFVALVLLLMMVSSAGFAFARRDVGSALLYERSDPSDRGALSQTPLRQGEACAWSVMGLVSAGDSSVSSAAARGGVTRIVEVDNAYTNFFGLYSSYCAWWFEVNSVPAVVVGSAGC